MIYYLNHFDSCKDIAIESANKGDDSDTTAAIAWGLKGIEIGYEQLPEDFKSKILIKDELEEIAEGLCSLRKQLIG